ncbi:unnamed protein product [Rotaria magnacalcarata]
MFVKSKKLIHLVNVFLFSPRKTGYHQCVGYLLANSRIRLDDTYVESFLRVFSIFTNRHQIETSARRLALEEIAMMFN